MKVKNDHHSKFSNLSNWNEEAWKAWFFFRLLLFNCLNWKIYCDDHSSLSSTTAVQKWIISYILHIKKNCPLKLMKTYLFRFISSSFRIYNIIKSKPTQTDTTLLDVICCVHLHTLLHVVACCWEFSCSKFETGQTFSYVQAEGNNSQHCWANKVGSCCIRLHA